MITIEKLLSFDKNDLQEVSKTISAEDVPQLVEWLSEKDDTLRYQSLLLLEYRSEHSDDVYPFWNIFYEKLKSTSSYHRSIGLILIADNAKWDKENKIDTTINEFLVLLADEKPITVRKCIQVLCKIVPYKIHLHNRIANELMSINIANVKETMRKLILLDILGVLLIIRKHHTTDEIESYIFKALSGGLLDKKAIKQIELIL